MFRVPPSTGGHLCPGGGDVRVSFCMWFWGFAPTFPNALPGQLEFEGCVFGRLPQSMYWIKMLDETVLWDNLTAACDAQCEDTIRYSVSTNLDREVRARGRGRCVASLQCLCARGSFVPAAGCRGSGGLLAP